MSGARVDPPRPGALTSRHRSKFHLMWFNCSEGDRRDPAQPQDHGKIPRTGSDTQIEPDFCHRIQVKLNQHYYSEV
jgi:hypothetical protein